LAKTLAETLFLIRLAGVNGFLDSRFRVSCAAVPPAYIGE
jgi:hypothetical protein